ncbi:MAG: hypothetical protein M3Q55_10045, partial [Acidobacteriota bacterium]|nr:hypothetical protein [Acidobacteriota bacterium]
MRRTDQLLAAGGVLTGTAALLHLAIIAGGPGWYRFFGAGEEMARMAARGSVYPTVITLGIAAALGVCALYGFSGAGVIRPLPFMRLVLASAATVFLARGMLGIPAILLVDDPYANELRT